MNPRDPQKAKENFQGSPAKIFLRDFFTGALSIFPLPGLPAYFSPSYLLMLLPLVTRNILKVFADIKGPLIAGLISLVAFAYAMELNQTQLLQRNLYILGSLLFGFLALSTWTRANINRAATVLAGFSLAYTVLGILRPPQAAESGPMGLWKFAIGVPVTILILYFINRSYERINLSILTLTVIGMLSMAMNFRSHAICCFAAAAILFIRFGPHRGLTSMARNSLNILFLAFTGLVTYFMPKIIASGFFGEEVAAKTAEQSDQGPIFFAGRTEPPLSFSIIQERFWFGWGDMREVPDALVQRAISYSRDLGVGNLDVIYKGWYRAGDTVTLHSVVGQFWAEGGVFSTILALYALFLAIRCIGRVSKIRASLMIYISLQLLWDGLFSSFSDLTIILWGLQIPMMYWALRDAKAQKRLENPHAASSASLQNQGKS